MDGGYRHDGLQFNYNLATYEKVEPVPAFQFYVSIDERNWFLALERDAAKGKFAHEALLVDAFKETRPQGAMNVDGGPDYRTR
jgi:hypothetical protein